MSRRGCTTTHGGQHEAVCRQDRSGDRRRLGVGRATCVRLAQEGAAVACLDLDQPAAEKTAADVRAGGGQARAYQVDVAQPDSVRTAVDAAAQDLGRPSVLVNSAGIGKFARTHEMRTTTGPASSA